MKTSESLKNIAPALVSFQAEVQDPRKSSDNPYFKSKYVELDGLMAAVRPIAAKHGLSILQDITTELTDNGKMKVWCHTVLLHSSGEWVESSGQFNIAKGTDPQSCGSSQTYIRRYDLSAFLGIAWDKDDDGNAASQPGQQPKHQYSRPQQSSPGAAPSHGTEKKDGKDTLPYKVPYIKDKPTAAQINGLEVMCQYVGRKPADLAKYYEVGSISDMQYYTFRKAYKTVADILVKEGYTQGPDLNWYKKEYTAEKIAGKNMPAPEWNQEVSDGYYKP